MGRRKGSKNKATLLAAGLQEAVDEQDAAHVEAINNKVLAAIDVMSSSLRSKSVSYSDSESLSCSSITAKTLLFIASTFTSYLYVFPSLLKKFFYKKIVQNTI